jgi:hypothetical protein
LKLQREEPVTEKRPGGFRLPKARRPRRPRAQHIEKALRCSANPTNRNAPQNREDVNMPAFGETTEKKEILIVVKTYPEISKKYTETVCTAGIEKETKRFMRIYPVRYRYLSGENRFRKYQWITAKVSKSSGDARPESYNIVEDSIVLGEEIKPGKGWNERAKWVLSSKNVFASVEDLIDHQTIHKTSMGIVRPKKIKGFHIEKKTDTEIQEADLKKNSVLSQLGLFEAPKNLELLPIRFMLEFLCNDNECHGHRMSVLDWEFGQLYRRVKNSKDWDAKIKDKVRKIFNETNEAYLILGNMAKRPHIFCILGIFYPPKSRQPLLF